VKASKLTARGLAYVVRAVGRKIAKAHRAKQMPHGKQTVKKLMAHGTSTNSLELSGDTKLFDRVADYELRPSRHNPDIRREMDAQAQIVGAWEDAKRVPEQKRLTWFYPDFGSYVSKEHITPEQLAAAARGVERQQASRAYKEGKRTISQQMQDAAKQAEADRGQSAPKKNAPDRGER